MILGQSCYKSAWIDQTHYGYDIKLEILSDVVCAPRSFLVFSLVAYVILLQDADRICSEAQLSGQNQDEAKIMRGPVRLPGRRTLAVTMLFPLRHVDGSAYCDLENRGNTEVCLLLGGV